MKIAIITFSDFNTNYGSVLQAFALKNYLENIGHAVTFIRYREFNEDPVLPIIMQLKKGLHLVYDKLYSSQTKRRNNNFEIFINDFLPHTRLYKSNDELIEKLPDFDAYICGSDQVWNVSGLGGLRKPYILSFVPDNRLKIAYACSMGDYKIDDFNRDEFIKLVSRLQFISVREEENVSLLQPVVDNKIEITADPVFLLNETEWDNWSGNNRIINEEYGVCYFVRRSGLCVKLVKEAHKKYHIPIYNLSDNNIHVLGTSEKHITSGPLEFLNIIKYSKFCIGTSFHLSVFCTIFKIPFLITASDHNKHRILNLLRKIGCEERLLYSNAEVNKTIKLLFKLTYIKDYLHEEIEASKNFLKTALTAKEL